MDKNEKQSKLLVRNRMQLQALAKFAKDDGASQPVIEKLELNKAIPFFKDKEYWEIPGNEWEEYLYPANILDADPDTSWACVN